MTGARIAIPLIATALAAGACKKKESVSAEERTAARAADAAPVPPRPPPLRRAEVEALLDAWQAAQNGGDFAGYAALYGEGFRGIRRSGKKTVQLDRSGWLADRERMFARPMEVAVSDVEIAVAPGSARIELVQDWSSGSYRDIGPKVIRVAREGGAGALRIRSEEMLSSMIVGPSQHLPASSPRFALIYRGKLLLADDGGAIEAAAAPKMLRGSLEPSAPDPRCETDPPDYEREHERYWACENARPENRTDHFIAQRPVAAAELPPALRGWSGRKVALHDGTGERCRATVGDALLWGEWQTDQAALGRAAADAGGAAEAVLDRGGPIVLARLEGACGDVAFARAAGLAAPPLWALRPATGALASAAGAALEGLVGYEDVLAARGSPRTDLIELWRDGGARLVAGVRSGLLSCQESGALIAVWKISGARDEPALELVYEGFHAEDEVGAAADLTGDGAPEIVLPDGALIWEDGAYSRLRLVDFPDEVPDCHCECE